jgi:hypothetical protein
LIRENRVDQRMVDLEDVKIETDDLHQAADDDRPKFTGSKLRYSSHSAASFLLRAPAECV